MAHEIKEKVSLRNRDNFVGNFDKEAESLARPQVKALRDALAEVFRSRRGIDLKGLQGKGALNTPGHEN